MDWLFRVGMVYRLGLAAGTSGNGR